MPSPSLPLAVERAGVRGALAADNAVAAVAGARMPFCTSVAAVIPLTAGA
jgi:hypothetical protein